MIYTARGGLKELWRSLDCEPEIDIVAVHGLNGDSQRTWTEKKTGICWLNHPDFLPKHVSNARVLAWEYNAASSPFFGQRPSRDRLHEHAQSLIRQLTNNRQNLGRCKRPIIFICHSTGGLIVKRALCHSQTRLSDSQNVEVGDIFTSTHAIMFFGTPHAGYSKHQNLAYVNDSRKESAIAYLWKMTACVRSSSWANSVLLSTLGFGSEVLANIDEFFIPLMKYFKINFFWEEEKTYVPPFGKKYIVDSYSAAPNFDDTTRMGIRANHWNMVRFSDEFEDTFVAVVDTLVSYCNEAPSCIRQRQNFAALRLNYEHHRDMIQRLVSLPSPVEATAKMASQE